MEMRMRNTLNHLSTGSPVTPAKTGGEVTEHEVRSPAFGSGSAALLRLLPDSPMPTRNS